MQELTQAAGTTLTATADAFAQYTRTFLWTIEKTVTPDTWDLFVGDSGTSLYTIKVTKGSGIDEAVIYGSICVTNGGAVATENLAITVDLQRNPGGGFIPVVIGQPVSVAAMPVLGPVGSPTDSFCYNYSITVPASQIGPGNTYKVTAHVTITNHSGQTGPFGPNPSATTVLPFSPTLINSTISVSDTNGQVFTNISDTSTLTYQKTFTCDGAEGTNVYPNTATIIYQNNVVGPSSTATVTVNCYKLSISKGVNTSFTRTFQWSIDKEVSEDNNAFADQISLVLPVMGTHTAFYRVNVVPTQMDRDFTIFGNITITNNAPIAAIINSITDVISGIGDIPLDCFIGSLPFMLAGDGASISCNYSTSTGQVPDNSSRINTATVTIQNYHFHYLNPPVPNGTTSFTAQESVIFSNIPSLEIDKCIAITDDLFGPLGTASAARTIDYSRDIGPYSTCGNRTVMNTASFVTIPCNSSIATGATGSDTATVNVFVPCNGCTYTIGFWKTHAGFTGNNPDLATPLLPIWLGTPFGLKSIEVTTAAMAVQILNLLGDASNGINRLYAQLLAAKLNIKNGADGSAVAPIIAEADAFLATHNSTDWSSLTRQQRNNVNYWATTLDNFNNGLFGPGHCSESDTAPLSIFTEGDGIVDTAVNICRCNSICQ